MAAALWTPAPWLPVTASDLAQAIIRTAIAAVGCSEDPDGSNRGPQVDQWNTAAGVPVGSYWCASFVGAVYRACGARVPAGHASCDNWMAWAKRFGFWRDAPVLGGAVLYGVPGDAKHIGIVIKLAPRVLSVEGNTTIEGSAFERNGTTVALKEVTSRDPVLGYLAPELA